MSDWLPKTIQAAGDALRTGSLTSVDLTNEFLSRIEAMNEALGAYVTVTPDTARAAAEEADAALDQGVDTGPLQGIPLAIKDIIATKDAPTTANSRVLPRDWGHGVDAPVVERLRTAGAVVLGKATTSEFACGLPGPEDGFLRPNNPWNRDYWGSGSSSGTSIAIVAGLALGGLGTDTGGSVRGPAAANGQTGLKTTFGRVPKNGVVPLGYSLDTVGPMARSAYDCALLLEVIAGYDDGDPCAAKVPVPSYASQLTGELTGLRVGVPQNFFLGPEVTDEVRTAIADARRRLTEAGAGVTDVTVPHAAEADVANYITMLGESFAYHRDNLIHSWDAYARSTRGILARAAFVTAGDYNQAQRFRRLFHEEMRELFSQVDLLLTPAAPGPTIRWEDVDVGRLLDNRGFTGQWNLLGVPAVAFPCGFSPAGLPLSLQIVGKPFDEATVLKAADVYQRTTDWHLRAPELTSLASSPPDRRVRSVDKA